jgi:hypothetical protein
VSLLEPEAAVARRCNSLVVARIESRASCGRLQIKRTGDNRK